VILRIPGILCLTGAAKLWKRFHMKSLIGLALAAGCGSGLVDADPAITSVAGSGGASGAPGAAGPAGGDAAAPFSFRTSDAGAPAPAAELSADGKNCGVSTHALARVPANVLLVLDRSGSMVENKADGPVCATRTCGTRWAETTAALKPALEKTQTGINWGLELFPVDDYCGVADGPAVPVAPMNAAAITARYTGLPPVSGKGYTPTRDAIQKASAYLRKLPGAAPGFILLATDGEPNCAVSGRSDKDATASIQAVREAAAAGTPVFVVGVSTAKTATTATLNAMAMAGARPRNDPALQYYAVDTAEDLVAALGTISAQVASCTFALERVPPVPDNVAVNADATRVPRDPGHASGWDYGPGMQSIQLFGAACNRVVDGTTKSVQMIFGCPGVLIE